MTRDHGDAKNTTEFAMSSCGGMRPSGMRASISPRTTSGAMPRRVGVHLDERLDVRAADPSGRDAVDADAVGPSSTAIVFAAVCTAAFDDE